MMNELKELIWRCWWRLCNTCLL